MNNQSSQDGILRISLHTMLKNIIIKSVFHVLQYCNNDKKLNFKQNVIIICILYLFIAYNLISNTIQIIIANVTTL